MSAKDTLLKVLRNPFWLIFSALLLWDVVNLTPLCFTPDWDCFHAWAANIHAHGLSQAYVGQPQYNYPPLFAYGLWLFGLGFANEALLQSSLYWIKLIPLALDFAAAVLVVKWAGQRRWESLLLLALIANPIYIFNSYSWGQIDSTYCALVFFSLYAAVRDRPLAAALLYTLAFNFKIQALLFAPLLGMVLLWKYRNPWPLRRIAGALGAALALQLAILVPFLLAGQLSTLFAILKNPVNYYPLISLNAFNFWHFFYGANAIYTHDSVTFFAGFTAQQTGLALFFGFSLLILGPPFWRMVQCRVQQRAPVWEEECLLLVFSLIPLGFFFFCTQMHERYSQPVILFLAVYAFRTRRYWLLLLLFAAYGLNVEYVLNYHQLNNGWAVLFDSRLVATLFASLLVALLWRYFRALAKPPMELTAPASQPSSGAPSPGQS